MNAFFAGLQGRLDKLNKDAQIETENPQNPSLSGPGTWTSKHKRTH